MTENEAWSKKQDILERIDEATAPGKMSKQATITWLEGLGDDLEQRIEALEEEIWKELPTNLRRVEGKEDA